MHVLRLIRSVGRQFEMQSLYNKMDLGKFNYIQSLEWWMRKCKRNRAFSVTWPAAMQVYWNERKCLHMKRVQLSQSQEWFGASTWPPFHCLRTPIWLLWGHVKTLYTNNSLWKTCASLLQTKDTKNCTKISNIRQNSQNKYFGFALPITVD